jgi:carbonic anhydrase
MNTIITALVVTLSLSLFISTPNVLAEMTHEPGHQSTYSKSKERQTSSTQHGKHGSWGYKGSTGPAHWGDLKPQFSVCKTGKKQSPIDLNQTFKAGRTDFDLDYQVTELDLINNGHTIKVSYPDGNYFQIAGQEYKLLQFHYHAPSEHTVNGRFYDMEIHFVHQNASGSLAVIGVFIDEGPENLALREIWEYLPKRSGRTKKVAQEIINARDLIPEHSGYYRYMGSLTTPPCSEGVNWFVMKQPIYASKAQLDKFRSIMEGNNRPTQPVNQRLIMELD